MLGRLASRSSRISLLQSLKNSEGMLLFHIITIAVLICVYIYIHRGMYVCMYVRMYVCMYRYTYAYIYIFIFSCMYHKGNLFITVTILVIIDTRYS